MTLRIVPIAKSHDRKSFDCGEEELNRFLRTIARQSDEKRATRTFVLSDNAAPNSILGFYTLVPSVICIPEDSKLRKRLPPEPPVIKLARLAVDVNHRGHRYGEVLLVDALTRITRAVDEVGGIGCVVDAKTHEARRFYERYGFEPLDSPEDDDLVMWLPIQNCREVARLYED